MCDIDEQCYHAWSDYYRVLERLDAGDEYISSYVEGFIADDAVIDFPSQLARHAGTFESYTNLPAAAMLQRASNEIKVYRELLSKIYMMLIDTEYRCDMIDMMVECRVMKDVNMKITDILENDIYPYADIEAAVFSWNNYEFQSSLYTYDLAYWLFKMVMAPDGRNTDHHEMLLEGLINDISGCIDSPLQ